MVQIKVRKAHLNNGSFEKTARNFGVSPGGLPSKKQLDESVEIFFPIEINGINGNVNSFISNAVNEETMVFKGETCAPRSCF